MAGQLAPADKKAVSVKVRTAERWTNCEGTALVAS